MIYAMSTEKKKVIANLLPGLLIGKVDDVKTVLVPPADCLEDCTSGVLLLKTEVKSLTGFQKDGIVTLRNYHIKTDEQNTISGTNVKILSKEGGEHAGLMVYRIDRALDHCHLTEFKGTSAAVVGGADLQSGDAKALFEQVVKDTAKGEAEPAMELLVEMYLYAKENGKSDIAELIASQCGYDALTSLAIVLQPYRTGTRYIDKDFLQGLVKSIYGSTDEAAFKSVSIYGVCPDIADKYVSIMNSAANPYLSDIIVDFAESVRQKNIVEKLSTFYAKPLSAIKSAKRVAADKKLKYAEAELRVLAALLHDGQEPSEAELLALYKKCTLNEPYICAEKATIQGASLPFYMSTAFLIARSDALMFLPMTYGDSLSDIGDSDSVISIDRDFIDGRQERRNRSTCHINHFIARFSRAGR
jgi:hypothetical protein